MLQIFTYTTYAVHANVYICSFAGATLSPLPLKKHYHTVYIYILYIYIYITVHTSVMVLYVQSCINYIRVDRARINEFERNIIYEATGSRNLYNVTFIMIIQMLAYKQIDSKYVYALLY